MTDPYAEFARELLEECVISDPWIEGRERFRLEPVVLPAATYRRMQRAGEAIGRLFEEVCEIVWNEPELLDSFFHLTPFQKMMWLASGGRWHGISRIDLFILEDGSVVSCEMNSDTPSGEAETVLLNRIRSRFHPELVDPNVNFEERFHSMVVESWRSTVKSDAPVPRTLGIIYPTDLPEDLSMIELYRRIFETRGTHVAIGSPFNIRRAESGELLLLDQPVDVVLRHYKTDWWSERLTVWSDGDDYADPDPLDTQLYALLSAEAEHRVAIVNPFGSVLTQNKLAMAFCWSRLEQLSADAAESVRSYIPPTYRLSDLDLPIDKSEWVLKSDYGCEGDEVIVGPLVTEELWQATLAAALPERWIAQRYFKAAEIDGMVPNYGLYLLGGESSAIFTRLSSGATDYRSVTAPTFIEKEE